MKNLTFFSIIFFLVVTNGFSQSSQMTNELAETINSGIKSKGFKEKLTVFETEIKKAKKLGDWEELAKAIRNDISLKMEIVGYLKSFGLKPNKNVKISRLIAIEDEVETDIIESWNQILFIHDEKLKKETPILLEALESLGNHNLSKYIGQSNHDLELQKKGEEYLFRLIALQEKSYGMSDIRTIKTTYDFGNQLLEYASYEDATKVFGKLVLASTSGITLPNEIAASAFKNYASLLVLIDQLDEAKLALEKLSKFDSESTSIDKLQLNLSKRSRTLLLDAKVRLNAPDASAGSVFGNSIAVSNPAKAERNNPDPRLPGIINMNGYFNASSGSMPDRSGVTYYTGRYKITAAKILVVIDEFGKVVEAKGVDIEDQEIKASVEKILLKTNFRPFSLDGIQKKMKGFVIYRHATTQYKK